MHSDAAIQYAIAALVTLHVDRRRFRLRDDEGRVGIRDDKNRFKGPTPCGGKAPPALDAMTQVLNV